MTTTEQTQDVQAAPAGLGPVGWLRWAWRLLTSMRTALILLFLFALASVPGSIYPQRSISPDKVAQYFKDSPQAAAWLDRLWLFDVFTSPWFAATYLLLFISLAGCVLPRAAAHWRELRRRPPAAPRNLSRLPQHAYFRTGEAATVESLAAVLRARRFRTVTGPGWVAAEKGYLRETGNLLFHAALLALLIAVGAGGLYGYRGNVLLVEGNGFANTVSAYDRYIPGQRVSPDSLEPFSFTLKDFQATYVAAGERRGQPLDFSASLRVADHPGAPERPYELRVNEPLEVNGTQTYLLGHGYAPTFKVLDGKGQVAFEGPVPCLTADQVTYTSECVIKVPDALPEQLGFLVRFLPTTVPAADGSWISIFPGMANPTAQVFAFSGDLGMNTGRPQSVYQLDTAKLKPLVMGLKTKPLAVGDTLPLPGGAGSIQLTGVREWISLQIAYDPGRGPALVAAALAVLGLVLSLTVRRRRVWVRVTEDGDGAARTVDVGGLPRTEGGDTAFAEEFGQIVTALTGVAPPSGAEDGPEPPGGSEDRAAPPRGSKDDEAAPRHQAEAGRSVTSSQEAEAGPAASPQGVKDAH
ncbi:cytochrome c biosynthesis protein [Sphaerisporangium melleum]|uniref:Cytochrome c biosynthesis protein n=1 Tax=Sphaerisporangium melleum TaxID=321316 RepID=A0A917RCF3_9ACTN|nr:cytochrome c biogenesis protein ResB [Sphaerisporangium melleum]GGK99473.1 cytochrome c biosynthesis protein [Sphaerisporangium melleum]GII73594.1 cytochrome c biosynthesis protein [Sphaerisporangium melleum]